MSFLDASFRFYLIAGPCAGGDCNDFFCCAYSTRKSSETATSGFGTKPTCRDVRSLVAIGGNADIAVIRVRPGDDIRLFNCGERRRIDRIRFGLTHLGSPRASARLSPLGGA